MPTPQSPTHPLSDQQQQHHTRKRRRRTLACTQCRSRKLRCDREYPACGRCQKSKSSAAACTYEDGFLWQQPNTVSSAVFSDRRGGGASAGGGGVGQSRRRTPVQTPSDFDVGEDSAMRMQTKSQVQGQVQTGGEKRDRFLETVLGAPKSATSTNQHSSGNTEIFSRANRPVENGVRAGRAEENDDGQGCLASPTQELHISPKIMMRGKETKTRFNGSGIFANLMSQFPDIRAFADDIRLLYPNLAMFRPELERIKRGLWKMKPLNDPVPVPDTRALILLLPPRRVVDELVDLYITYVEPTLRILHGPSFFRELDSFWTQKESPNMVSPAFAAQLLLILACAWNLADMEALQSKIDIRLDCYRALEWVIYAEKWIVNADIKRPELTAFRIYILLITAQNSHGMGRSKAWLATGTLVKQAMLSGYHRDPSRHTKISVFNKEMRRRIWATIVELDLQIAMDRGMPPSVQESDYDTAPPLNINDDEIHEGSTELPPERPLSEMSDSSCQAFMCKSLPVRLKVCRLMQSPRVSCRYDDILRLDWELNKHLSAIPPWSVTEADDIRTQHQVALLRAIAEAKIGQSLLCLHVPFAIEAQKEPLFIPSARAQIEVSIMILSTQKRCHDTSRPLSLSVVGDWTLQAYYSTCQFLHTRDKIHGGYSDPLKIRSNVIAAHTTLLSCTLPGFPESLVSLAETILTCLESRSFLIVKGGKDYFFMSTVIALVKAKLWPTQAHVYKQKAVDRILFFAQNLFSKHAHCNHLGEYGMGSFANQTNFAGTGLALPLAPGFDGGLLQPASFAVTPPTEFDPYPDMFDWEDLTGFVLGD